MKTKGSLFRRTLAAICWYFLCAAVSAQIPTVGIFADRFPPVTGEPCPVCRMAPVKITLNRTGKPTFPLDVHLQIRGTATAGADYPALPDTVTIPAGESAASIYFSALDDAVPEGPEVVEIAIRPDMAAYAVASPGQVQVVIGDDEAGAPPERLDLLAPANGAAFSSGVTSIKLEALAVSISREIDVPVEFLANGVVIGRSDPIQYDRLPVPLLPRLHELVWLAPADGEYVLTARTPTLPGQWLEAPPIHLTVGPVLDPPLVSIKATARIAEEDSAPTMRPSVLRGGFTLSRTGNLASSLPVWLHVSGSAVAGVDYRALPIHLTFQAGQDSINVPVEAIPDHLAEPLETVIAEVSNCPPPGIRAPCFLFAIDPAHQRDTVFIRDDGITRATLELTAPQQEAHFATGQVIPIEVVALDLDGAITSVDFYDGTKKIGTSTLYFLIQPPPGTPVHHSFAWTGASEGSHTLTARATASAGGDITSLPVPLAVGSNRPPLVVLTHPAAGSRFPSGGAIEITASATDPDGYVVDAEFFADGHKLGGVHLDFLIAPPPGQTRTFSFTWRDATPGSHLLSARVRDNRGAAALSAPVTIAVTVLDALPVIVVFPSDPFAVEPSAGTMANPAVFRLRRYGPTSDPLVVNFSLGGSAAAGTDYTNPGITATFPAGASSVPVGITPLLDNLREGRETVIFKVEPQFDDGPLRYHVGHRRRAVAVIADLTLHPRQHGAQVCTMVAGGHVHLCFPAADAVPGFRIEASDDFSRWETIHETSSVDDAVHFVDPDAPGRPRRFYRLAEAAARSGP